MRLWPLFAALHMISSDTEEGRAIRAGITRLRHKFPIRPKSLRLSRGYPPHPRHAHVLGRVQKKF